MVLAYALFVIGLLMLYYGAEWLVVTDDLFTFLKEFPPFFSRFAGFLTFLRAFT